MVTQQDEIINKSKQLIQILNRNNLPVEKMFLFGSFASGRAHVDSDIDLAIVSNRFIGNRFLDKQRVNPYTIPLDSRFEVHPYRTDEFKEDTDWFVREILDTGIEIT